MSGDGIMETGWGWGGGGETVLGVTSVKGKLNVVIKGNKVQECAFVKWHFRIRQSLRNPRVPFVSSERTCTSRGR